MFFHQRLLQDVRLKVLSLVFTNLDAKGTNRSVNKWTTSFLKVFAKKIFLRECQAIKNSVTRHYYIQYVCMKYFECFILVGCFCQNCVICLLKKFFGVITPLKRLNLISRLQFSDKIYRKLHAVIFNLHDL